jgi:hypothetical protein
MSAVLFSPRDPYYFFRKYIQLLTAIHLLSGWQRLALAFRLMEVSVSYATGRIVKMLHCSLK